jgi:hypothetical protein
MSAIKAGQNEFEEMITDTRQMVEGFHGSSSAAVSRVFTNSVVSCR